MYARAAPHVPPIQRVVDMLEEGVVVVRHIFYGESEAEAAAIEAAHVKADESFRDALTGRPYNGAVITAQRVA